MESDEKACSFCGEPIKAVAIKCKHCKSDLTKQDEVDVNFRVRAKYVTPVILLGGILFSLFLSNPSKDDFIIFAVKHMSAKTGVAETDSMLDKAATGFAGLMLSALVEDKSFGFFTLFHISSKPIQVFVPNAKDQDYVGIAGTFIPLGGGYGNSDSSESGHSAKAQDNLIFSNDELHSLPEPHSYQFSAIITNRTDKVEQWPSFDLSLKNSDHQIIFKKLIIPNEYLPHDLHDSAGIAPNGSQQVTHTFSVPDNIAATDYVIKMDD